MDYKKINESAQTELYLKSLKGDSQISIANFIEKHLREKTLDLIDANFIFTCCVTCRDILKLQKMYDNNEDSVNRFNESSYYYGRLFRIANGEGVPEKNWDCKEAVNKIKQSLRPYVDVFVTEIKKGDKNMNLDFLLNVFDNSKKENADELFNIRPEYFWSNPKLSRKKKITTIKKIGNLLIMSESESLEKSLLSDKMQEKANSLMSMVKNGKKIDPVKEGFKLVKGLKDQLKTKDVINTSKNILKNTEMSNAFETLTKSGIISREHIDDETRDFILDPKNVISTLEKMVEEQENMDNIKDEYNTEAEKKIESYFSK